MRLLARLWQGPGRSVLLIRGSPGVGIQRQARPSAANLSASRNGKVNG